MVPETNLESSRQSMVKIWWS